MSLGGGTHIAAGHGDALAARLGELGVDAMLVTGPVNLRYLTGYTGSNGLAVIADALRIFVTDFRYVEQAAAEVDSAFERRRSQLELTDELDEILPGGELRLGFEAAQMTVRRHARLREQLPARIELVPLDGAVETLRAVKSDAEVAAIRAASELADQAFRAVVLESAIVGRTEREIALELEVEMRRLGAERVSFEPIIASGAHGALPHAFPREVPVEPGRLVVVDWGAELGGYCSDCTRTVATGPLGEEDVRVYELVRSALLVGLEGVRPGVTGVEADGVARQLITAGGHGEEFGHGLGHGVGLEVHEAPRLSFRSEETVEAGNVVTVEPGVYLAGRLGVRIEDLVVVRESGGPEILTTLPRELLTVT